MTDRVIDAVIGGICRRKAEEYGVSFRNPSQRLYFLVRLAIVRTFPTKVDAIEHYIAIGRESADKLRELVIR